MNSVTRTILAHCLLYGVIATGVWVVHYHNNHFEFPSPQALYAITVISNAESRLARGERIPYATCSQYDLELIPRVSDSLSTRLIAERERVLELALRGVSPQHALEAIYGVGPKTAQRLREYIYFPGEKG